VVTNELSAGTAAALYEPLLPPINRSNHSGGAHSRKATIGLTGLAGSRFQPPLELFASEVDSLRLADRSEHVEYVKEPRRPPAR
jgi:hypothetical protein